MICIILLFICLEEEPVFYHWTLGQALIIFLFPFFCFLGLHPQHMKVLRLGVESELQLLAYTTDIATDLSRVCDLHHSSWQCRILNPLSRARDQTCILMDTSWICYCWAALGTPSPHYFSCVTAFPLFLHSQSFSWSPLFRPQESLGRSKLFYTNRKWGHGGAFVPARTSQVPD